MNKQTEKMISVLDELKSTGFFNLLNTCNSPRGEEKLFYNKHLFTVCLYFDEHMTFDEFSELATRAYKLVDQAEKEYLHALNHPNPMTALNSYLTINK